MKKRVLVTGGAGFIGSHTVDALVKLGHEVSIYDNLSEQVHPGGTPEYASKDAEFVRGDMRDLEQLRGAVRGADMIYHLAAAVGTGQSMYQIADYMAINSQGTANLLQAILDTHAQPEKLVVASSMSTYGEGKGMCRECGEVAPQGRPIENLRGKRWDALCPNCGREVSPLATDEEKPLQCSSVYALSKKTQEELALLFGRTYNIPVVSFRYFNVYGTRQALSNPYTGVAAIFASRLMNGNSPVIFEDGLQTRDFVSIHDVVQANVLALESSRGDGMAINVGSGRPATILEIAEQLGKALKVEAPIESAGKYRAGDIRHCFADIRRASELLGYRPRVTLSEGLTELVEWLKSQTANDHVDDAMARLQVHGLVA
ncbi:MAG TPA: SDR family NAD(P)-dependent oxidoreductase [Terriglobales bacterium]|nr:SDR family NAD(P)-dependent oxidoreductase [Terriglobales bacterium]